jgi:RNA-directed DNA polymerase
METREYESGRSKCPGVMRGIGAATRSTRKRGPSGDARRVPTSGRCFVARKSGRTLQTEKQRASRNVSTRDGASVSLTKEWNSIDWSAAGAEVKRLQMRIAKAVEEGRWGRAKALQHILTHSFHAKALAVRRVTSNKGKKTPGVDGVVWKTAREKMEAVRSIEQRGYRAQPLRRVRIPKKNSRKKRPLSIPCMADRAAQAVHKMGLDPIAETLADPHSYGFPRFRSCADAIAQLFALLAKRSSPCWILEADIEGCFDRIDHAWLERFIPMKRHILRQWLKAGYIENGRMFPTEEGTPQGGIASPVLANMTLDGLEATIRNAVGGQRVKGRWTKVHLVRFADDFVVPSGSKEVLVEKVLPAIEGFLRERGLNLSKLKTRIVHISEGFDFLSQTLRKFGDKLIIRPAKAAVQSVLATVREQIRRMRSAPVKDLVGKLNPILRGWANYHRHIVSSRVFGHIDWEVSKMLWRWAKRRHRKKNGQWILNRYWRVLPEATRFTAAWVEKSGKRYTLFLFRMSDLPIKRHVRIKGNANPYSPSWQNYFTQRVAMKAVGG